MYVGYVCINFSWALSIRQAPSGASIHTRFALHVMGLLNPGVYVCIHDIPSNDGSFPFLFINSKKGGALNAGFLSGVSPCLDVKRVFSTLKRAKRTSVVPEAFEKLRRHIDLLSPP